MRTPWREDITSTVFNETFHSLYRGIVQGDEEDSDDCAGYFTCMPVIAAVVQPPSSWIS